MNITSEFTKYQESRLLILFNTIQIICIGIFCCSFLFFYVKYTLAKQSHVFIMTFKKNIIFLFILDIIIYLKFLIIYEELQKKKIYLYNIYLQQILILKKINSIKQNTNKISPCIKSMKKNN